LKHVERFGNYWNSLILEQKLAFGEKLDKAVVAYYADVPLLSFNHAANINVSEREIDSLISEVSEFFESKGVPFACFMISPSTRPKSLTSILLKQGFKVRMELSMMAFEETGFEERMNPQVSVRVVTERDSNLFTELMFSIFEMPSELMNGFNRLILQRIRKGLKCYIGSIDDEPVGTCGLFSSAKVGEIYAVGTLKDHRGRGIGTTLTLHAIRDSIKDGNDIHVIRAEKGGYPEGLYKRMGFKIDHTISFIVKSFK
jgi:ribosomal protein S18 acetylase RimI-like enzyme